MTRKGKQFIFLSKRRPQNRDLFLSPYGRFYYIPKILSQEGDECHLVLGDYQGKNDENRIDDELNIHSTQFLPNPFHFLNYVKKIINPEKDVWIIGFSDIYFGILAVHIAHGVGAKSLIDAYDNYESYIPWAKPLHWIWRHYLKNSDYLTAAGPQLLALISSGRNKSKDVVLPMAADPIFKPQNKIESRHKLNLPRTKILIGYIGSANNNRGISTLLDAMNTIAKERPDILFIMSGFKPIDLRLPKNVKHLGYIEADKVPILVSSLDLSIAINLNSSFGLYSYPIKIYEALASQRTIIASNTPASAWVLREHPELLFASDSPSELLKKIYETLDSKNNACFQSAQWSDTVEKLRKDILEK